MANSQPNRSATNVGHEPKHPSATPLLLVLHRWVATREPKATTAKHSPEPETLTQIVTSPLASTEEAAGGWVESLILYSPSSSAAAQVIYLKYSNSVYLTATCIWLSGMWTIRRGRKEKLNLKEWDDGWDTDREEGSWFSYVQDRADRDMLIQSERHTIQTKGFGLPLPSCVIEPVNLGDPWHFQRIRALTPFAVAHFNKKKGKNLVLVEIIKANYWEQRCSLLTLRFIDKECDTGDATYAACSVCDMGLYRLMVEHARKFKLRYTLCLGQIGLNHPFHRCRIPQSVMAALAYYKENQKLSLRFYEVSRAEVFDFGFNKIHYKINFHANYADPISKMELQALVVYDNAQHGEMIEVEDVKIISVTEVNFTYTFKVDGWVTNAELLMDFG
ncbi:hypothetical protein Tsubulata_010247 [Turnera subulata]|uniref:Uncharacterized protein n=1 Tax=Turnera subulata TaxID=218843 RepID=A0A9Q0GGQ9_9ROSI|nr:hypothetical protein Tsubulata_010247 [Turnera subulata]